MTLTLILGMFYIAIGLVRVISSIVMQYHQWGWTLFSGIAAIAIGILIAMSLPVSGLIIIGIFVGIDLLIYGANLIALAITAKNAGPERTTEPLEEE